MIGEFTVQMPRLNLIPLISPFIKTFLDHVKYSWNVAAYLSMTNCPNILRQIFDELQLLQIEYFIVSCTLYFIVNTNVCI